MMVILLKKTKLLQKLTLAILNDIVILTDFKQNNTRIAVFGKNTVKAAQDSGLRIDIEAPLPKIPSMSRALDVYIEKANKAKA